MDCPLREVIFVSLVEFGRGGAGIGGIVHGIAPLRLPAATASQQQSDVYKVLKWQAGRL
jgi:hypothetical protein